MRKLFDITMIGLIIATLISIPSRAADSTLILPEGVSEKRFATEVLWSGVKNLPAQNRPRIILVLGGGGARGLSHIGVLRVLAQEQIPVDEIVGVSVGALIGALYSSGLSADQIESMAHEIGWDKLTDVSKVRMMKLVLSDSLFSSQRMETYLNKHIGEKNFSDLKIPFSCLATDIRTGDRVVFHEGPVAIAARASATLPGLFAPVSYRHRDLVDGGLVDNLPIDIARERDENTIVIGVLPKGDADHRDIQNVFKSLVRAIEIQRDVMMTSKKKEADFMIEPDVGSISIVDLGRIKECIDAGVLASREKVLDLKGLIIRRIVEKKNEYVKKP